MCGIAGVLAFEGRQSPEISIAQTKRMTDRLAHRGPDGEGMTPVLAVLGGGHLLLGHRRLSIVDITGGVQPMCNHATETWLTFNGEIYNFPELRETLSAAGYSFETESDTEVVLAAYLQYGVDCVKHFNGMFALAIWDERQQRLFMARDSFGKKPFYYKHDSNGFQFASELKAFDRKSNDTATVFDPGTFEDCMLLRYVPGGKTLFQGIFKLEPGMYATYKPSTNSLDKCQYYQHPDSLPRATSLDGTVNKNTAHIRFLELLRSSVSSRINCDVPFGAFLSGGIDSTAVVALMSECMSEPVKTFSVGFEQRQLSELDSARLVADRFKTDHHEKVIKPEDLINYLPEAIFYRDGPVSEASDIPILLLSRMAREKVKMVLTGEGSDEILGGYPKHSVEAYSALTAVIPIGVRQYLRRAVRQKVPTRHEKIKIALNSMLADSRSDRMQRWFGSVDLDFRDHLLSAPTTAIEGQPDATRFEFAGGSALRDILAFDQSVWLPNNLLERGDRMTMAVGLEARMPFLDVRLAEFVSQLPDRYRVRGKTTKWILRRAVQELIPDQIIGRKKVGFKVPIEDWFRSSLADYLNDLIVAQGASIHEYIDSDAVTMLFDEHHKGKQNHEKILWSLLNIEIWLRQLDRSDNKIQLERAYPANTGASLF